MQFIGSIDVENIPAHKRDDFREMARETLGACPFQFFRNEFGDKVTSYIPIYVEGVTVVEGEQSLEISASIRREDRHALAAGGTIEMGLVSDQSSDFEMTRSEVGLLRARWVFASPTVTITVHL